MISGHQEKEEGTYGLGREIKSEIFFINFKVFTINYTCQICSQN